MSARGLLAQRAAFAAAHLGWVGWIGLAALLGGALAIGAGMPLLARASANEAAQVDALRARLALQSDPRSAARLHDPRAALLEVLPAARSVSDFVAAIQRRADAQAVQIDRTEYRVQPVLGHAAQRYRLHFPAHADYLHLRAWLEGLLHDYPSLSLEELSVRRATDGGEELEANVGLSFFAREEP